MGIDHSMPFTAIWEAYSEAIKNGMEVEKAIRLYRIIDATNSPDMMLLTSITTLEMDPEEYHNGVRACLPLALRNTNEEDPDREWNGLDEGERDTFHTFVMRHVRRFIPPLKATLTAYLNEVVNGQNEVRADWWKDIAHPADTGPILWLDSTFFSYLRAELVKQGPKSKEEEERAAWTLEQVATLERASVARWEAWEGRDPQVPLIAPETWQARADLFRLWTAPADGLKTLPRWLPFLAALVWKVEAKPQIERSRRLLDRHPAPGLARSVVDLSRDLHNSTIEADGRQLLLFHRGIGIARSPVLDRESFKALKAIKAGGTTLDRLIRWLARQGWHALIDGWPDPRLVAVHGEPGMSALVVLAGLLGFSRTRDRGKDVEDALTLLNGFDPLDRRIPKLVADWRHRGRAEDSILTITLGEGLLPYFTKDADPNLDRAVLPALEYPTLPKNHGISWRSAGLAGDLQWRLLDRFREDLRALDQGGWEISRHIPTAADSIGLLVKHAHTMAELWLADPAGWILPGEEPGKVRLREGEAIFRTALEGQKAWIQRRIQHNKP